ncbi:MAG: cephalosporin hydroxylase family protein [bacterium]|nr:cephalosporin hydroxylase family protein [bacterium]
MKNPIEQFKKERIENVKRLGKDKRLKFLALKFTIESLRNKYSYNFDWLGRPIIQHPQDIVAIQELIWEVKPDLVIETGIAHGGSLILSASILELLGGNGKVLGIDIDIRKHNRVEIERHRMFKRIIMIEGSSIDGEVVKKARSLAKGKKVAVFLDSNHSHAHVLRELELYSPFVSKGSYIVAFDTIAEYMPKGSIVNRLWGKGNSPATAVAVFLKKNKNFANDRSIENKLLITSAPGGFLKRIK